MSWITVASGPLPKAEAGRLVVREARAHCVDTFVRARPSDGGDQVPADRLVMTAHFRGSIRLACGTPLTSVKHSRQAEFTIT